eukprot:CAMPEP_0195511210 /NCGR_PEP_ID=MMETSP0794_2-20130614/3615_1 /TAXON_ID=515487 /ORGANISM="Stephanopyxis turris, Strain CCMP 815" /LENGTH=163 /DNA_ID=CAMNT_0040638767 /DNA_START=101 /DNA_END=593 /DNA_ORIENTATION=+
MAQDEDKAADPDPDVRKASHSSAFGNDELFVEDDLANLQRAFNCEYDEVLSKFLNVLDEPSWYEKEVLVSAMHPILMRLAAQYLVNEKRRGKPLDGVAKFHIRNGAEMYRLNFLADKSRKGMQNSAGMMINYRYEPETIEKNFVFYEANGSIAVKDGVAKWLT